MSQPIISVVIPVYNASKQLTRCLVSLQKQTFSDFEVWLVDDGSTDTSATIIQNFQKEDSRFRLIHQQNSGPSLARNAGIANAQGIYLTFVDADDWLPENALELLFTRIEKDQSDLVCGGYYEVNAVFPNGQFLHDFTSLLPATIIAQNDFQQNIFLGVTGVLWAKLFKTKIFRAQDIQLDPVLRLSEDLLAVLDYGRHIHTVSLEPNPVYFYNRLENEGLSGHVKTPHFAQLALFGQKLQQHQSEMPFLDFDVVLRRRTAAMAFRFLTESVSSFNVFSESAHFLKDKVLNAKVIQASKGFRKIILQQVTNGNFKVAWWVLRFHSFLRNLKNG